MELLHLVYVALLALMMCETTMVDARLLRGPQHGRQLHATSIASAVAAPGSSATSTSQSSGSAVVDTAAIGVQGGHATAQQSADKGNHTTATVSVGNETTTVEYHSPAKDSKGTPARKEGKTVTAPANSTSSHTPSPKTAITWDSAPACPQLPTTTNSQKDKSGRLWGFYNGASCAFKAPVYDLWDSAPACPPSVSPQSGVKDKSGRLWGYYNRASCAFKDEASKAKSSGNHSRLLLAEDAANNAQLPAVTPVTASTAVPVVLVDSVQPTADAPAAAAGNTVVSSTYGSGPDAVQCTQVTIQDEGSNVTRTQLKCEKASPEGGNSVPAAANATAFTSATPSGSPAPTAVNAVPSTVTNAANKVTINITKTAMDTAAPTANNAAPGTVSPAAVNEAPSLPTAVPETVPQPSADVNTSTAHKGELLPVPTAPINSSLEDRSPNHTEVNRFGVTFEAAPACVDLPNKRNSVQDTLGRLWWYEDGRSCAYRDAHGSAIYYTGYQQVKWETSPACTDTPSLVNSMSDAEGRLWGWIDTADGANCKFVDAAGHPTMRQALLDTVLQLAVNNSKA